VSLQEEITVSCPYCGTPFAVEAEPAHAGQGFIEDCPVCCRPVEFSLHVESDGSWRLTARRDDE